MSPQKKAAALARGALFGDLTLPLPLSPFPGVSDMEETCSLLRTGSVSGAAARSAEPGKRLMPGGVLTSGGSRGPPQLKYRFFFIRNCTLLRLDDSRVASEEAKAAKGVAGELSASANCIDPAIASVVATDLAADCCRPLAAGVLLKAVGPVVEGSCAEAVAASAGTRWLPGLVELEAAEAPTP